MIKVVAQPEPHEFDELVRQPGNLFLTGCPSPNTKQFASHAYWQRIKSEFRSVYNHVCAYSCQFIPLVTGSDNVEHFSPKNTNPSLAYEWTNYRLVCGRLNSRKGTRTIIDPLSIEDGWFQIKFPSLLISPDPSLPDSLKREIINTINILRLNDEVDCLRSRYRFIDCYCLERFGFDHLYEEAPFLAKELIRQDLVEKIKEMWVKN